MVYLLSALPEIFIAGFMQREMGHGSSSFQKAALFMTAHAQWAKNPKKAEPQAQ